MRDLSPSRKGNSRLTKLFDGLSYEKIQRYNNSPPYVMARWPPQQIPPLNFLDFISVLACGKANCRYLLPSSIILGALVLKTDFSFWYKKTSIKNHLKLPILLSFMTVKISTYVNTGKNSINETLDHEYFTWQAYNSFNHFRVIGFKNWLQFLI